MRTMGTVRAMGTVTDMASRAPAIVEKIRVGLRRSRNGFEKSGADDA